MQVRYVQVRGCGCSAAVINSGQNGTERSSLMGYESPTQRAQTTHTWNAQSLEDESTRREGVLLEKVAQLKNVLLPPFISL